MEAKIYNLQAWLRITHEKKVKKRIYNILKQSNFKIFNYCEYYFEPIGYTAIWLLGESHCAVHTFPEENKTYLELSSCSKQKYENFISIINNSDFVLNKEESISYGRERSNL
jgi:S-adenosylmethionine decarboxylase